MTLYEDYHKRQTIIQEVVKNLGLFEDEIKLEIEKVKRSETALPDQQLDCYLLYLWTVLEGSIMEIKEKIAQSDRLLQELMEAGKKELERRGLAPIAP
jgi:hypothetical protein